MARVFLGCPTHDGRMYAGCAKAFFQCPAQYHEVESGVSQNSLLTFNCNLLWSLALKLHATQRADWFAMLHSDVEPEPLWIDKLIMEAERHNADVMTTVIPIKDEQGLTSTAIGQATNFYQGFRLTMAQVRHPSFPATFDHELAAAALRSLPEHLRIDVPRPSILLGNTGCMVCKLGGRWCDPRQEHFDESTTFQSVDNHWKPWALSEDWNFTARAGQQGAKVMATTSLKVLHHGGAVYPNDKVWGMPLDVKGLSDFFGG